MTGAGDGWRFLSFPSLPSTSDLLAQLAAAGEPDGLAVLAGQQTAARGSRGRSWTSPEGALCLSALLRPGGPAASCGCWALLAGLALHEALLPHVPGELRLKWPNDLLLDGRKLAGVLLDSAAGADGRLDWLVMGFGANLGAAPAVEGREVAALGGAAAPEPVARAVLARLAHWRRVRLLDGFAPVRRAWLARAHPPGTRLALALGGAQVAGEFDGLADDGALLLRTAGRVRAFPTGEVLRAGTG